MRQCARQKLNVTAALLAAIATLCVLRARRFLQRQLARQYPIGWLPFSQLDQAVPVCAVIQKHVLRACERPVLSQAQTEAVLNTARLAQNRALWLLLPNYHQAGHIRITRRELLRSRGEAEQYRRYGEGEQDL